MEMFNRGIRFREMCGDYLTCLDAFEHWQESDRVEANARQQEREILLHELEREIVREVDHSSRSEKFIIYT